MNVLFHGARRYAAVALVAAAFLDVFAASSLAMPGPTVPEARSPDQRPNKSGSDFSLLPNSLRKNPDLCETVYTEVTAVGKKLPVAKPERPQFYVLHFSGFDRLYGPATTATISAQEIERVLRDSLAKSGYVASDASHPPSLLIFYTWGSTTHLADTGPSPVELFLEKASLVGGDSYETLMKNLLREKAAQVGPYGRLPNPSRWGESNNNLDPFSMYEKRSDRNEFLFDQVKSPLYFIIASAYDFPSATARHRILLWRTRMTVDASGVSDEEAFPSLIAMASSYFGRETLEPRGFRRRPGEPIVEVGTPVIVEEPVGAKH